MSVYLNELITKFNKGLEITLSKKKYRTQAQANREVRRYAKRFDKNNLTTFYEHVVEKLELDKRAAETEKIPK